MQRERRRPARPGLWTALLASASILSTALWTAPAQAGTSFGVNRIRYVAATGSETENCQSLRDVLSSIDDNSSANRYLVRLEPGTYDCGEVAVTLGPGIALVGAGVDHTLIRGEYENNLLGLVHINDSTVQLRSLTVFNSVAGATQDVIGVSIFAFGGGEIVGIQLRDVDIFGNDFSISAFDASFEVWSSYLPVKVEHEGTGGTPPLAIFRYSAVESVTGGSPKACYFCYNPFTGITLDNGCQEP